MTGIVPNGVLIMDDERSHKLTPAAFILIVYGEVQAGHELTAWCEEFNVHGLSPHHGGA